MKKNRTKKELSEEVEFLEIMVSSLVELLEERGVITQSEWERRAREHVNNARSRSAR